MYIVRWLSFDSRDDRHIRRMELMDPKPPAVDRNFKGDTR